MTLTTAGSGQPQVRWLPPLGSLGAVIAERVEQLQATVGKTSATTATLARLRKSLSHEPGSVPAIWELTTADLPGQVDGDDPTPEERAAHVTLTLYAVHQQAKTKPMHVRGTGFGKAVRRLAAGDREAAVRRRLDAVATATSFAEAAHHLRALITQLRSAEIPLDYGQLADDLLRFQRPGGPETVRRRWGRQYYLNDPKTIDNTGSSDAGDEQEEAP